MKKKFVAGLLALSCLSLSACGGASWEAGKVVGSYPYESSDGTMYSSDIPGRCATLDVETASFILDNTNPGIGQLQAVRAVDEVDLLNKGEHVVAIEFKVPEGGTKVGIWGVAGQEEVLTKILSKSAIDQVIESLDENSRYYTAWEYDDMWSTNDVASESAQQCLADASS